MAPKRDKDARVLRRGEKRGRRYKVDKGGGNVARWHRRVGLAAPLQLVHKLHAAQRLLREMGKRVLIGDKAPGVAYDGQVTGCNYGSAISVAGRVEAFVVLGGGTFHALGLALATGKMTIAADPFLNDAVDVAPMRRRVLKQRWALISKAEGYDSFGVIVGLKPGQRRLKEAMGVKARLERHGKQAVLLSISDVDDEALRSFEDIDAFVNTACPRVAIDDLAGFSRPMFLPAEIDVAMGEARWDADNPLPINDHFRLILG
ncbi:TPA: hypothetical protein EYP44_00890 [Candidatus Bathyarchaeota archaeon]|nr:hypothetical protein [Candidatus Bathyarchaeota archaeon]